MRDGKSAKDKGYSLRDWFKGGGWVQAGGKYDGKPCAKQPGQKTKPYCRDADDRAAMSKDERNRRAAKKRKEDPNPNRSGKAKIVRQEEKDHEVSMAQSQLSSAEKDIKSLKKKLGKKEKNLPAWMQAKITDTEHNMDAAASYATNEAAGEKDACYKKVKASAKVWPSAYASGRLVQCRKKGAANYGNSKNESYEYSNWRDEFKALEIESIDLIKPEPLKGVEIDEKCWQGYTQKGMKKKGKKIVPNCVPVGEESEVPSGNIKKLAKKAVKRVDTDADGDVDHNDKKKGKYGEFVPSADGKKRIYTGESYTIDASAHKKAQKREKIRSLVSKGVGGEKDVAKRKLGNTAELPKLKEFSEFILDVKEGCELKYCPKCKKIETRSDCAYGGSYWDNNAKEVSTDENGSMEVAEAAWTKKAGKNPEGGLNEKGRKSYERENPGSDLKAPSKKVGNPRRKSFCARMKGMKKKLTSAKTANDPDSRINKSLRAWNC